MERAGKSAIASDIRGVGSSWISRTMSDAKMAGQGRACLCATHEPCNVPAQEPRG